MQSMLHYLTGFWFQVLLKNKMSRFLLGLNFYTYSILIQTTLGEGLHIQFIFRI